MKYLYKVQKKWRHKRNAAGYRSLGCLILCVFLLGCGQKESGLVMELTQVQEFIEVNKEAESTLAEDEEDDFIYIYVCGAVTEAKVVALKKGSRGFEAIEAAGGFLEDADVNDLNLASVLSDGDKLYVPTVEEGLLRKQEAEQLSNGIVNINTADAAALCTLPGIGESRAAEIIAYREKNGSFQSIEDIMKVPGIKTAAFSKICDKITID